MTSDTRRQVGGALFYGGLALIAVLVVFAIIKTFGLTTQVRETQQAYRSTLEQAQAAAEAAKVTANRIEDCTTPGRDCYDDAQKRTAEVIGDLNRVIAYAAACADQQGVQTEADVYSCVIEKLAEDDGDGG